jgi:hypothetical protein
MPHLQALLHLPEGHARHVLSARLAALSVGVTAAQAKGTQAGTDLPPLLAQALTDEPDAVAFIDLDDTVALPDFERALTDAASRSRCFFTRLAHGHVGLADRRWVKSRGFGGLWGEFDADDADGDLADALSAVGHALRIDPAAVRAAAMQPAPDALRNAPARELIRGLTGAPAEVAASVLSRRLAIRDRIYHLRTYPACFVGREAVDDIARCWGTSRGNAIALGQALHAMGLLTHVVHEHDFADGDFFYRLSISLRADTVNLSAALSVLHEALPGERDGTWEGTAIVDVLSARFELARHEAWIVGQRLAQFRLIEHVLGEHGFRDDHRRFRFAAQRANDAPRPTAPAPLNTQAALLPTW